LPKAGRVICKINKKGFIIHYFYNADGQLLKRIVDVPSDPQIVSGLKPQEAVFLMALNGDPKSADIVSQLKDVISGKVDVF